MRILWHSVAPWSAGGYGNQTAVWVPRLASLGHEVAISAYYGLAGGVTEWRGHEVYPGGDHRVGADVLAVNAAAFGADLVITLTDVWALGHFEPPLRCRLACWAPVESSPLSKGDREVLTESGATPIAVSEFGHEVLLRAGFDSLYVPHGIDCSLFTPGKSRHAQNFTIGIVAANWRRKAWREQLTAFAAFRGRHENTRLYLHTSQYLGDMDLRKLTAELGISDAVRWPRPLAYKTGLISQADLVAAYRQMDLYSGCAYGEGFGLPLLEAQACGVPAVATDFSAMSEVCAGWLVPGELTEVPGHETSWMTPDIGAIEAVYEAAYRMSNDEHSERSRAARRHALAYDADLVLTDFWKPALESLMSE